MNDSERLTLLSYGAGQESWGLLLLYVNDRVFRETYAPGRFVVALSDTMTEHPHTYEHIEYTKEYCAKHGIEFHHITPDLGFHTGDWNGGVIGMLEAKSIITSAAFPNSSCTASVKLGPIYKWFDAWVGKEYGFASGAGKPALKAFAAQRGFPIDVQIGFAVGEESRAGISTNIQEAFDFACINRNTDPKWMQAAIRKTYPLIDIGFDRAKCQEYAKSVGERAVYPSACWSCHWKSDADVLWTSLLYPDLFARWVAAEATKIRVWADEDYRRTRSRTFQSNRDGFKNSSVGGKFNEDGTPILLPQRAQMAREAFALLGIVDDAELAAYLDERRMREGHGVKSRAA